ncbi:DUF2243 domain-containing protein [Pseudorhodoferax sp. Leaf267]|uniref:DUF2243 domain-containing protein n=1 Tax=Pseudorhodoferax sp. Leaf267 TaxID=1736316 RepID=UPI0006F3005E|nr:DUF2243 domain-containing protein [Pseudorhodoferax sp. Leaf267]KQP23337.1 hypothetical protein ASF43_05605 [Pseudorhodoferax sp. Leaf267]
MKPSPGRSAALLGLSLGCFFDGILLHQVLQWHHLLSDVRLAALQDMRMQMLADGLFHLLMYVVAGVALVGLWRARHALQEGPGAARRLGGAALAGFGGWHILDAVLSHWLTGIHRVRGDAADPLFWDLLWFAVFGLLPLAIGLWLRRGAPPGAGPGRLAAHGARAMVGALVVVTLGAATMAATWPAGDQPSLVVFGPGIHGAEAFNAVAQVDARVLWADRSGDVWLVQLPAGDTAWRLVRSGAWLVGGSWAGWGCANWTR